MWSDHPRGMLKSKKRERDFFFKISQLSVPTPLTVFTLFCFFFFRAAVSFSDGEKEQLRKFTNRSYLLDKTSRYQVWLGLVDILLAYSYEVRSTEGEHTVSA